jgi:hypothetical protein
MSEAAVEPVEEPVEPEPEPGLEPEPEPEEPAELASDPENRCDEETSIVGTPYRCSLNVGHEGEHFYQTVDGTDSDAPAELADPNFERRRKSIQNRGDSLARDIESFAADYEQELLPCPRCANGFLGFCWHPHIVPLTEEEIIAVKLSMGEEILPDYQQDPYRKKCETCEGWGRTATFSHVANQGAVVCDDCNGKGWKDGRGAQARPVALAEVPALPWSDPAEQQGEPDPRTQPDSFGTPPGAPYYGVMLHLRPDGWQAEVAAWEAAQS